LRLLLLLCRERRRDVASALLVEKEGILFVDVLLFFFGRIGTRDIEAAVLHEVEIGVAAAGLAPTGKFGVACADFRRPRFPGRPLLREVGAFLEIDRRTRVPPLRMRAMASAQCTDRTVINSPDLRDTITDDFPNQLKTRLTQHDLRGLSRHYSAACHPEPGFVRHDRALFRSCDKRYTSAASCNRTDAIVRTNILGRCGGWRS
jgi:hypothetical protein